METNANLGYRSLCFWGKPPILNPVLRRVTDKATNKAKVMLAREKKAIEQGILKGTINDGKPTVLARRARLGKYNGWNVEQSTAAIVRTTRQYAPTVTTDKKADVKAAIVKDVPKKMHVKKQGTTYTFRLNGAVYQSTI